MDGCRDDLEYGSTLQDKTFTLDDKFYQTFPKDDICVYNIDLSTWIKIEKDEYL